MLVHTVLQGTGPTLGSMAALGSIREVFQRCAAQACKLGRRALIQCFMGAQKVNGGAELVMNRRKKEGSDGDISSLSDGR